MNKILYSIEADMDISGLYLDNLDYGQAKFMYDRWRADPEVFNIVMYRHEEEKKIMLGKDEIYLNHTINE
jgi:hypothetical protein